VAKISGNGIAKQSIVQKAMNNPKKSIPPQQSIDSFERLTLQRMKLPQISYSDNQKKKKKKCDE
jgi:hypothetical protein